MAKPLPFHEAFLKKLETRNLDVQTLEELALLTPEQRIILIELLTERRVRRVNKNGDSIL